MPENEPQDPQTTWAQLLVASVFLLLALGVYFWFEPKGVDSPDKDPAAVPVKVGNGKPLSATETKRPWDTPSGRKDSVDEATADPDVAPVVDAWLEKQEDEDDSRITDGLLGFVSRPDLGLAEKSQAIDHALNLIPDQDFAKLDVILADPATPIQLLQRVLSDMHDRSERATLHAALLMIKRTEPDVVNTAKGFLARWVDLHEQTDLEAIRLQAETRLLELEEDAPPPSETMPEDSDKSLPEDGLEADTSGE